MGLLNARNLNRAKQLLEKNRHKVGDVVAKSTEKLDTVSKGKTSGFSKKAEEAARKFSSGSSATHHGVHPDSVSDGVTTHSSGHSSGPSPEAATAMANAFTNMANAATEMMNKAAQAQPGAAQGTAQTPPPPPPAPPAATQQ